MSEAVTMPTLMMTSIVSDESLARDTHTHTHTHTRTHIHTHTLAPSILNLFKVVSDFEN